MVYIYGEISTHNDGVPESEIQLGEANMKVANFLGGALFALGLLAFLYGIINQATVNSVSGFGSTGIPYKTYLAMMGEFRTYQLGGCLAAVLGAGLASLRRE